MTDLTVERLKQLLTYNRETGVFRWRVVKRNNVKKRQVAGSRYRGRIRISIDDRSYEAGRLAWLYMTGKWPTGMVDHENRIPSDNRWKNLREASHAQNCMNAGLRATNTSGFKGVELLPARKKRWRAFITQNGRRRHLGVFETSDEARLAYLAAAAKLFGEFAPGEDTK